MKKILLFGLAVAFSSSITAQSGERLSRYGASKNERVEIANSKAPQSTPRLVQRQGTNGNSVTAADIVALSTGPNAFTCANSGRSNVNYNKDVNALVWIHRNNPASTGIGTSGYYNYDKSLDGGANWTMDQPVYADPTGTANYYRGRYPLCGIYNAPGNMDPNNAYVVYDGPVTLPAGGWQARAYGVGKMDNSGYTSRLDSFPVYPYSVFPENLFVVKNTNDVWKIGSEYNYAASGQTYQGNIIITKGVWNAVNNDYDYTNTQFPVPVNSDLGGIIDMDLAFSDDGMTGYLALITNNDASFFKTPDSTLYLSIFKTSDGGVTWSANTDLNVQTVLDPLLADSGYIYGTNFDLDVVMDANNNLHILTAIMPSAGWAVYAVAGWFGMFDIYTDDGGTTWKAELLGKPITHRGVFGDGSTANPTLNEDLRPFAARSWDGTKLFFNWFETDTINWPGVGNLNPDLRSIGYDVTSGMWSPLYNMTAGTNADGFCTFGNGSYYVTDNGSDYSIPAVVQILADPIQTGSQVQFYYIKEATITGSSFTNAGNPVTLPLLYVGIDPVVSPSASFSVTSNYPNPFSGKTQVDVSLSKAANVTVEVRNTVGQLISVESHNLSSGINTLTLDASKLESGMYFYSVISNGEKVTRTMMVQ